MKKQHTWRRQKENFPLNSFDEKPKEVRMNEDFEEPEEPDEDLDKE